MDKPNKIISKLNAIGYSDTAIADAVGSNQPTIWKLRTYPERECRSNLYIALAMMLQGQTKSKRRRRK